MGEEIKCEEHLNEAIGAYYDDGQNEYLPIFRKEVSNLIDDNKLGLDIIKLINGKRDLDVLQQFINLSENK